MEMLLWAVGLTIAFLFSMWMIIESDDYLINQTNNPWDEADNDSKK